MRKKTTKTEKKKYVKTLSELARTIGVSRDCINNYRDHPDIPEKTEQGYPIEAWRKVLDESGAILISQQHRQARKRTSSNQYSLREQLTLRDIELRDLEIQKRKKQLIPVIDYEQDILSICNLLKSEIETLPDKFTHFRDSKITEHARKISNQMIETIRNELSKLKTENK